MSEEDVIVANDETDDNLFLKTTSTELPVFKFEPLIVNDPVALLIAVDERDVIEGLTFSSL